MFGRSVTAQNGYYDRTAQREKKKRKEEKEEEEEERVGGERK